MCRAHVAAAPAHLARALLRTGWQRRPAAPRAPIPRRCTAGILGIAKEIVGSPREGLRRHAMAAGDTAPPGLDDGAPGTSPAADAPNPDPQPGPKRPTIVPAGSGIFIGAFVFLAMVVFVLVQAAYYVVAFGTPMNVALSKTTSKLLVSAVFRQIWSIVVVITLMRVGLEPAAKKIRDFFVGEGTMAAWEKSSTFLILREVYRPVETLLFVGAAVALAENLLPTLIRVPRTYVNHIMRTIMTLCVILSAMAVVFKLKDRALRETSWQYELSGEKTQQRRVEAIDKLVTIVTITVGITLSLQAIGFDVNSLLAIGGIGGIALSLAGREILENLFNGLVILSSTPFETGDEVWFKPAPTTTVEGIVVDVGWFRTQIRSFEREVWVVPNSVFSKVVVLNVTRKGREFRYFQKLQIAMDSVEVVQPIIAEMRAITRRDPRIIQKLHRRVYLNDITTNSLEIIVSFYIDAPNQDATMAQKENFMLTFIQIINRNGGRLLRSSIEVTMVSPDRLSAAHRDGPASDLGIERIPVGLDDDVLLGQVGQGQDATGRIIQITGSSRGGRGHAGAIPAGSSTVQTPGTGSGAAAPASLGAGSAPQQGMPAGGALTAAETRRRRAESVQAGPASPVTSALRQEVAAVKDVDLAALGDGAKSPVPVDLLKEMCDVDLPLDASQGQGDDSDALRRQDMSDLRRSSVFRDVEPRN